MDKRITVAIAGLGNRGYNTYAQFAAQFPERMRIAAVADTRPDRVALAAKQFHLAPEQCYSDAETMLAGPRLADILFVCTQDGQHAAHAIAGMERGYHILLEKPIAPTPEQCSAILETAERTKRRVVVCHVLRYTPFFGKVKELLDSGVIGELVTIQHQENVGYWHQAHSFVRGNWRRTDETSFMLLAKCCHDLDLLLWLSGKHCRRVSSFGSTYLFRADKAPAGAALRCLDGCAAKDSCPYDAEKIYLTDPKIGVCSGNTDWPCNVLVNEPTPENVRQAIETGPYGRCVYHCDNDVVDHQVVNMELTDGVTAQLTMSAFTSRRGRDTRLMGTMGEIIANMDEKRIIVEPFGGEAYTIDVSKLATDFSGHAGGDVRMVEDFLDWLETDRPSARISTLACSMESHFVAFAAEKSRLNGGQSVEL